MLCARLEKRKVIHEIKSIVFCELPQHALKHCESLARPTEVWLNQWDYLRLQSSAVSEMFAATKKISNQPTGSIPSPASRRPSTSAVKVSLSEAPNPSLLSHAIWITPKLWRISLSPSVILWSLKQTNNTEACWCCFLRRKWKRGQAEPQLVASRTPD